MPDGGSLVLANVKAPGVRLTVLVTPTATFGSGCVLLRRRDREGELSTVADGGQAVDREHRVQPLPGVVDERGHVGERLVERALTAGRDLFSLADGAGDAQRHLELAFVLVARGIDAHPVHDVRRGGVDDALRGARDRLGHGERPEEAVGRVGHDDRRGGDAWGCDRHRGADDRERARCTTSRR